jgi:hypothetical protein
MLATAGHASISQIWWVEARWGGGNPPYVSGMELSMLIGGRYWTRTSDLVRVKHAL